MAGKPIVALMMLCIAAGYRRVVQNINAGRQVLDDRTLTDQGVCQLVVQRNQMVIRVGGKDYDKTSLKRLVSNQLQTCLGPLVQGLSSANFQICKFATEASWVFIKNISTSPLAEKAAGDLLKVARAYDIKEAWDGVCSLAQHAEGLVAEIVDSALIDSSASKRAGAVRTLQCLAKLFPTAEQSWGNFKQMWQKTYNDFVDAVKNITVQKGAMALASRYRDSKLWFHEGSACKGTLWLPQPNEKQLPYVQLPHSKEESTTSQRGVTNKPTTTTSQRGVTNKATRTTTTTTTKSPPTSEVNSLVNEMACARICGRAVPGVMKHVVYNMSARKDFETLLKLPALWQGSTSLEEFDNYCSGFAVTQQGRCYLFRGTCNGAMTPSKSMSHSINVKVMQLPGAASFCAENWMAMTSRSSDGDAELVKRCQQVVAGTGGAGAQIGLQHLGALAKKRVGSQSTTSSPPSMPSKYLCAQECADLVARMRNITSNSAGLGKEYESFRERNENLRQETGTRPKRGPGSAAELSVHYGYWPDDYGYYDDGYDYDYGYGPAHYGDYYGYGYTTTTTTTRTTLEYESYQYNVVDDPELTWGEVCTKNVVQLVEHTNLKCCALGCGWDAANKTCAGAELVPEGRLERWWAECCHPGAVLFPSDRQRMCDSMLQRVGAKAGGNTSKPNRLPARGAAEAFESGESLENPVGVPAEPGAKQNASALSELAATAVVASRSASAGGSAAGSSFSDLSPCRLECPWSWAFESALAQCSSSALQQWFATTSSASCATPIAESVTMSPHECGESAVAAKAKYASWTFSPSSRVGSCKHFDNRCDRQWQVMSGRKKKMMDNISSSLWNVFFF